MSDATIQQILDQIAELPESDRELLDRRLAEGAKAGSGQEAGTRGTDQHEIEEAIERSHEIVDVADDWDDEGSPGYSQATWERAVGFVRNYARHLWSHHGVRIPAPRILPGPEGSIDIHWEEDSFELLVNIPRDGDQRAEFYGDDHGAIYIKGSLDPSGLNRGLIEWLQKAG